VADCKEKNMGKRLLALAASALMFLALGVVGSTTASAAPIECPGNQTAERVDGSWQCVNPGGNTSNAEDPKNPNAGKDKF
jgi:hypothetical protein